MLDGSSWVRNSAVISSRGSTQKIGAGRPAPGVLALRSQHLVGAGVQDDREAEPEADAVEAGLGEQRPTERLEVGVAGQVVAGHVVDRPRAEQPDAVELAAGSSIWVKRR